MKRIITFALLMFSVLLFSPASVNAAPKLSKTSMVIAKGKTYKLKVTGSKKKIRWSSKNKRIATVSKKGVVRGKKNGKTYVYAKVGKKALKCRITVTSSFCYLYDFYFGSNYVSYRIRNMSNSTIYIASRGFISDDYDEGYAWADTDSKVIKLKPNTSKELFFIAFDDDSFDDTYTNDCTYYIKRQLWLMTSIKYKKSYYYIYCNYPNKYSIDKSKDAADQFE